MCPIVRHRRSRRAVILLLTLWIVVVLALLANSLAFEMKVEMKLTSSYRDSFLANHIARLGIARAVTDLRNDNLMFAGEGLNWQTRFDALGDIWSGGTLEPREFEVLSRDDEPAGIYRLMVIDEESKLNINNQSPVWPEVMRNLFVLLDVDEDEAQDLANAIQDWIDQDDQPAGPEGASEIEFYSKKLEQDKNAAPGSAYVFYPKNSQFDTLDELLQIPGMTAELYYGYDPEEVEEVPFFPDRTQRRGRDRKVGLKDLLTVSGGRLNINTARRECLTAILAAATGSLRSGEDLADDLISHRQGSRADDINNDRAFKNLADLGQVSDFNAPLLAKLKQVVPLTTQSDFFTIFCEARTGQPERRARNSGSRDLDRPVPTTRLIVGCKRSVIPYQLSEEEEEEDPLPGYRIQTIEREDGQAVSVYVVPVVYFSSWNNV
ncbi:general secretion pathway protein GspK [bacterium]|nr:general secretion pathway protein GspK [bacterium]